MSGAEAELEQRDTGRSGAELLENVYIALSAGAFRDAVLAMEKAYRAFADSDDTLDGADQLIW